MSKKVFISYRKLPHSIKESSELKKQLEKRGYIVFRDKEKIDGGVDWQNTIYDNVRDSSVLIVLLEPGTEESEWVQREVDLARGAYVSIFPLRLGNKQFSDADIEAVQKKLVIREVQYSVFYSDSYARAELNSTEQKEVAQNFEKLLDDIERLILKTHSRQREWASRIAIRHAQNQAQSKGKHFPFEMTNKHGDKVTIYLATGDLTEFEDAHIDVIVNSENDYMQMARFFETHTLSSKLRRSGAYKKNLVFLHDRLQEELDDQVDDVYGKAPVPLGQILVTSAGHPDSILVQKGIRYIFHASTNQVDTTKHPFELKPVEDSILIENCVKNCLRAVTSLERDVTTVFGSKARFARPISNDPIRSIAFPIFGTGHGGLSIDAVVPSMMNALIQFILEDDKTNLKEIYLCVYSKDDVQKVKRMMQEIWEESHPKS